MSRINIINVWQKGGGSVAGNVGRPKAENPKSIRYSIRLDEETEKKLLDYCEKHKITKGEAIRRGIHLLLAEKK